MNTKIQVTLYINTETLTWFDNTIKTITGASDSTIITDLRSALVNKILTDYVALHQYYIKSDLKKAT